MADGSAKSRRKLDSSNNHITVDGVKYATLTSLEYICLECGLRLHRLLACAHAAHHTRNRLSTRSTLLSATKSPAVLLMPNFATKSSSPTKQVAPQLTAKTEVVLQILPQKRGLCYTKRRQHCRQVHQSTHLLVQHLDRLLAVAKRSALRSLRLSRVF